MSFEPIRMRRFVFERIKDNNATSGEGTVVEGVQFTDGKVALRWRTPVSSLVIWDNIESALLIHGHGGDTRIRWIDPPWPEETPAVAAPVKPPTLRDLARQLDQREQEEEPTLQMCTERDPRGIWCLKAAGHGSEHRFA